MNPNDPIMSFDAFFRSIAHLVPGWKAIRSTAKIVVQGVDLEWLGLSIAYLAKLSTNLC